MRKAVVWTLEKFRGRCSVSPSGCWVWLSPRRGSDGGYGTLWFQGKAWLAHRVAYFLFRGDDPGDLCVCHHCDTPPCCNPEHLFLGTRTDNYRDMEDKGRRRYGSLKGSERREARINEADAAAILRAFPDGPPGRGQRPEQNYSTVAKRYGISRSLVSNIVNGRAWTHVSGGEDQGGRDTEAPQDSAAPAPQGLVRRC